VKRFDEQSTNHKVILRHARYEQYWDKILTQMAGGTPPDVIFLESTRMQTYVKRGSLLPIDDLFKKEPGLENRFYPGTLDAYRFQNKIYALPNDFAFIMVFYNKDHFEKAGITPPSDGWSWDEFRSTAKKLTVDIDGDGIIDRYGYYQRLFYFLFMWANGGDFFDNAERPKKVVFNSKATREALQFLYDLRYKDKVSPAFGAQSGLGMEEEGFKMGGSSSAGRS